MSTNLRMAEWVRQTARFYECIERGAIVLMTVVLVVFALYQIVLRNFFSTGLIWGDNFLRHLVLWICFLGACRATAEGKHIQIDLPALVPAGRIQSSLTFLRSLFLTMVSTALLYASWLFVLNERSAGEFAFLKVPYWWLEIIFPLSFLVMTLRSLRHLGRTFRSLGHPVRP
jgi:TRAP-type C4-dicarboxylate transport system permease small subunit